MVMKESIMCCISCILPCGALDVIRIVHVTGRVEEISRPSVHAREILRSHPKHVLRRSPSHDRDGDGVGSSAPRSSVAVPADAELQRGKIYFLVPVSTPAAAEESMGAPAAARRRRAVEGRGATNANGGGGLDSLGEDGTRLLSSTSSDRYLSEILSEKVSTATERRRGRVGIWRPRLESIAEVDSDG